MQKYSFDIIGTHLDILFDTDEDVRELSRTIGERLTLFEARFSRFLDGNWLHDLNEKRSAVLDVDAKTMLTYMLDVARKTDGYFDPTVGKRLTELGYGKVLSESNFSVISTGGDILPLGNKQDFSYIRNDGKGDYRDIEIVGDEVMLHSDILLEFGGVGKGYLIDVIREIIEKSSKKGEVLEKTMEGEWCRFSPGKGGVRGGYTEYNPSLLEYAKKNRKQANDMEKNMWLLLRGEKLGYKFHRQKPLGEYIVDFYAPSLQLVIEIDGENHVNNLQYDKKRTEYLNSLGIHVLRYTNTELAGNLDGVRVSLLSWIEKIKNLFLCNPSQPPLFRGGVGTLPTSQFSGEGPKRYLINFGGDLYGKGGWKVGLESPFASDEVIGTITLEDDFLACSAGTKRKWGAHHHLIDPHTGESAREVVASYIEGSSGMMTDAYATTLCVMPWDLACSTLEKTPEISGVIVRHDGVLYQKWGSGAEVFS